MYPAASAAFRMVSASASAPFWLLRLSVSCTMAPGSGRSGQFGNCAEAVRNAHPTMCIATANLRDFVIAPTPLAFPGQLELPRRINSNREQIRAVGIDHRRARGLGQSTLSGAGSYVHHGDSRRCAEFRYVENRTGAAIELGHGAGEENP